MSSKSKNLFEKESNKQDNIEISRREHLKSIGLGALAFIGSTGIFPSLALAAKDSDTFNNGFGKPIQVPNNIDISKQQMSVQKIDLYKIFKVEPTLKIPSHILTIPKNITINESINKINKNQLRSLIIPKPLPRKISISEMGLTPEGQKLLTPAARSLTKADLVNLGNGNTSGSLEKLTVKDVKSIQAAFGSRGGYNPQALDISCCCCTPCCCAAASTSPVENAA